MSKLAQARRITALKGHFTRLLNQIRILLGDDFNKEEVLDLQNTLNDRRDLLVDEIYTYLDMLTAEDDESNIKEREKEIAEIDAKIDKVNDEVASALKQSKLKVTPKVTMEPDCVERISLPRFNGSGYFRWKAMYDCLVHNQHYTDLIKMLKLLSCLDGEPKELLKNYPLKDHSYSHCISRLEQVYGGDERHVSEVVRQVRTGKTVDEENLAELRRFVSTLEAAVVALGENNENLRGCGTLYQCARERLSSTLAREYTRWTVEQDVSEAFSSLITFLSKWSKIIESAPQGAKSRQRPPMISHNQMLTDAGRNVTPKRDFLPTCAWHQKEAS